jgi:hypothetical protein
MGRTLDQVLAAARACAPDAGARTGFQLETYVPRSGGREGMAGRR